MGEPTEELQAAAEEQQSNPVVPHTKVFRERTEAQKQALERARAKAMLVRAENAALKRKELEVERALLAKSKADRAAKINAEYEALATKEGEEMFNEEEGPAQEKVAPTPKKRKPARRVVVTEVSSASDSEASDVEVILPRARKQPMAQELKYQHTMSKMFSYS